MREFKVATFNVKNLIGADSEYYAYESYTPEEFAWKKNWLARQLLKLDADIVCFQEIFDEKALWEVIEETNRLGEELNAVVLPPRRFSKTRSRSSFPSWETGRPGASRSPVPPAPSCVRLFRCTGKILRSSTSISNPSWASICDPPALLFHPRRISRNMIPWGGLWAS